MSNIYYNYFIQVEHSLFSIKWRKGRQKMNTVLIAGHAKLPARMAAKSIFETLTITAEVDKKYGVIIDANCTLATEHGR